MPDFWCANFDDDNNVLAHGIEESLWLMQYQYSHDGHTYQGAKRLAATSKNWKILGEIKPGDWLVAYLRGSRFFAIGEVIEPRLRQRHRGKPCHADTIHRTVHEHRHLFLKDFVRYTDGLVFYEDFLDPWNRPVVNDVSDRDEIWQYAQRIDVKGWQFIVRSGVVVRGLAKAASYIRDAIFRISEPFFNEISAALQQVSCAAGFGLPEEVAPGEFVEGAIRSVTVNAYERNPDARLACIKAHGTSCCVCGFNFGSVYGPVAEGYIHVHHLKALSEVGGEYTVDSKEDLCPICPNCHAIVHRRVPAYSIEELRTLLERARGEFGDAILNSGTE